MRDAFQTALFNELEPKIGPSFKKAKDSIYRNHKNGFYVYAKPNKCDPNVVAKYIGRYLGRPVIATSHIDHYDGDMVTFHCNHHEDDKLVAETIPALNFIDRLIQHIPEKHRTLAVAPFPMHDPFTVPSACDMITKNGGQYMDRHTEELRQST